MPPPISYTRSGAYNIAYQIVGDGPIDLVYVPPMASHLDAFWELEPLARYLNRLASFSRLILFDKRGTGLSDRISRSDMPTFEERMDDIRAVMDAAGSEKAALLGSSESGPLSILFAATYPHRVSALVLTNTSVGPGSTKRSEAEVRTILDEIETRWGSRGLAEEFIRGSGPSMVGDEHFAEQWTKMLRMAASPGDAATIIELNLGIDVTSILSSIAVPTLLVHRPSDNPEQHRLLEERIPGAKRIVVPGEDHYPFLGDQDAFLDEIEAFVTGVRPVPKVDRVLATIMMTDIVGSTETASKLGDRQWREILGHHHAVLRNNFIQFRGREVDNAGDGFLATFDGPARAVNCAATSILEIRALGLEIRAGVHTGEVELVGDNIAGLNVHIAARVASLAGPGEVLVSSTVKDLVAGSGLTFDDRGSHALKGVPGEWNIYAASV